MLFFPNNKDIAKSLLNTVFLKLLPEYIERKKLLPRLIKLITIGIITFTIYCPEFLSLISEESYIYIF